MESDKDDEDTDDVKTRRRTIVMRMENAFRDFTLINLQSQAKIVWAVILWVVLGTTIFYGEPFKITQQ